MPNLNKVMLIGNVTRDPEVKFTPKGTAVAEVSMAINRTYTPEGGERREETTFVEITFWGRQAEIVGEYAKKGKPIYVEGRLQLDTWDDKQTGQKRSKLRVVGDTLQLLGSRSDGDEPRERSTESARAKAAPAPRPAPTSDDDDIPF